MEIKTFSPKSHKIKALIYWAPWSWKTSFWGTAKDVLFASAEWGLLSIADKWVAHTDIKSLQDLEDLRDFLKNEEHNFETLVIDSITEINDIIKTEIVKENWRKMQIQDWGDLANSIENIIRDIRDLDMNVVVIAQELNVTDEDKIQKIVPSLNWKSSTKICYYMDIVWYIWMNKEWERFITTETNERYLTKDRTNKIWDNTEPDFEVWRDLVSSLAIWEETILHKTLSQAEILEENQKKKFKELEKQINKSKNLDELKNNFLEINKNKSWINPEQYKKLCQIKDELKIKLDTK